jgi:predicted enzyme related to lactoylglutathione lyase
MAAIEKVGNVFVEASDFAGVVEFYGRLLDRSPQVIDPEHGWAQFELGSVKIGVAKSGSQQAHGNRLGATVSLKTLDLTEWAAEARNRGLDVAQPTSGAHEAFAAVRDPAGNVVLVYAPLAGR